MIVQPLVSVLMTAYNRELYIAEAIESVLASTLTDFELIVVDDCSTDNTVEIARKIALKDNRVKVYLNDKNLGDYANRNKAASYASGKYIKYFDSDDIMYPHCLQVMVTGMEKFPQAGYGLSATGHGNFPLPVCISPEETYLENYGLYDHFLRAPGSAIIKRSVFEAVGGFNETIQSLGDMDMWMRLAQKYPLVKLQFAIYFAREHQQSESTLAKDRFLFYHQTKLVLKYLYAPQCPVNRDVIKQIVNKLAFVRLKIILRNMAAFNFSKATKNFKVYRLYKTFKGS